MIGAKYYQNMVKMAMLGAQRFSWEQGVAMQALYEDGDTNLAVSMAHDAVARQGADGRLAIMDGSLGVADPAACGEVVWRSFEITGDRMYADAARKMLKYLTSSAPKTADGIICHTTESLYEGYSAKQIWSDALYMVPPFIASMGALEEAIRQLSGMYNALIDREAGLLRHIYDAEKQVFVDDKLWATGNAWALLGLGRVIDEGVTHQEDILVEILIDMAKDLLDHMLPYMTEDGRFHDTLDDSSSFLDGTSAMMVAALIYRGYNRKWLTKSYLDYADRVLENMDRFIDDYGMIHGVCGAPTFDREGTSVEAQAAYLMMHTWKNKR